ncbi:hypothetical protein L596_006192 [Steinernema carpocapsae]|nr:hypothetical protein L596_006192 [Steinernema carpocapsae]
MCMLNISKEECAQHTSLHVTLICQPNFFTCKDCEALIQTGEECENHKTQTGHAILILSNPYFQMLNEYVMTNLLPNNEQLQYGGEEEMDSETTDNESSEDEGEIWHRSIPFENGESTVTRSDGKIIQNSVPNCTCAVCYNLYK